MADPITLGVMAGWAFSGPFQGMGDRAFCRAVDALRRAFGDDSPRNHDVQTAIRRAQVLAVRATLKTYLKLDHPDWRTAPGYSPDDLERKLGEFIRAGLMTRRPQPADPAVQAQVEQRIEQAFVHPEPHEGQAADRQAAFRELAQDWTLAELRAAVGAYGDWARFEAVFREGGGGKPWWATFRAVLAEEVKDNAKVAAILTQQGLSAILERQIEIAATLAEMREGLEREIAYALRESQREWHGVRLALGADDAAGHRTLIQARPTELIIARYRVMPFLDRDGLLAGLLAWARDTEGPQARGRLYVAPGGFGKTRLLIEALRVLDLQDWRCTFLSQRNTEATAAGALADLVRADDAEGVCVVLDYAEGQTELLRRLCEAAAGAGGPVRIVALARSPEGWWTGLHADAAVAPIFEPAPLAAIQTPLSEEERGELFAAARQAFARELTNAGLPVAPNGDQALLTGRALDRPLTVAMAAYLAARGELAPDVGVLEQMYMEERKHWKRALAVTADNAPELVRLHRLMAQVTLVQSAIRAGARKLIAADPLQAGDLPTQRDGIIAAAERLYGHAAGDEHWLMPVEPDLLGEHVALRALQADGLDLTVPTLRAALGGPPLYASDSASLLTVLERAQRPEHDPAVRRAARDSLGRLQAAVGDLTLAELEKLDAALPRFSTGLAHLAATLAQALCRSGEASGEEPEHFAGLAARLNTLAVRLSEVGDRAGALGRARRAVAIYEDLTASNPEAYLPDLAMSLNNLASFLSEVGDHAGALESARRAVAIYEDFAALRPAVHLRNLAMSMNNLAIFLSAVGDRAGTLEPARQAVVIYEDLAVSNPAAYLPDLAGSLNNLANFLSDVGERAGALAPARRAVAIYEDLAASNSAAYLPDLAMSLNNLANRLSEVGDRAGALEPARRAVAIREDLAASNPAAYLADLATSLAVLGKVADDEGSAIEVWVLALGVLRQAYLHAPQRSLELAAGVAPLLGAAMEVLGRTDFEAVLRDGLGDELHQALTAQGF